MKRTMIRLRALSLMLAAAFLAVQVWAQTGSPYLPGNETHDQRTGSLLIYNYYKTGYETGLPTQTVVSLTNVHDTDSVRVKVAIVNGVTGTTSLRTMTVGPKITSTTTIYNPIPERGFVITLAVNEDGAPKQFNYLIGSATIFYHTYKATLGAVAVPMKDNGSYAALPRQLALDDVPSPADSSLRRMVVINHIGGSLENGLTALGILQGDLFNHLGAKRAISRTPQGPQDVFYTDGFYLGRFNFPSGQFGWLRIRPQDESVITGAVIYPNYLGSFNLRHLTNASATLDSAGSTLLFGY